MLVGSQMANAAEMRVRRWEQADWQTPNSSNHHCWLSGPALVGSRSQELELILKQGALVSVK